MDMVVAAVSEHFFFNSALKQFIKMKLDGHCAYVRAQQAVVCGS